MKRVRLEGKAFRPFKILYATMYAETVRPSFIVDISREFPQRMKAIRCYASQFGGEGSANDSDVYLPLKHLEERVTQIVRHYGQMIGVAYGEPFLVREMIAVDDIVKLPVRSI